MYYLLRTFLGVFFGFGSPEGTTWDAANPLINADGSYNMTWLGQMTHYSHPYDPLAIMAGLEPHLFAGEHVLVNGHDHVLVGHDGPTDEDSFPNGEAGKLAVNTRLKTLIKEGARIFKQHNPMIKVAGSKRSVQLGDT